MIDTLLSILDIVLSLAFVFFAIGYCIFCHELGHFVAAKWRGLHVDAFALGFKPFWRKKYKGVEYRLGYLPFGGYCDIPQVDATSSAPKAADGTVLERAKPLDRIITAVAGPLFNLISGMLVACIVWICGMPQDSPKMREITVLEIPEKSPEYAAGLRKGDRIVKLNGKNFHDTWAGFTKKLLFAVGEIELEVVKPDGKRVLVKYVPQENPNAPGSLKREKIAYPFFTPLIPVKLVVKQDGIAYKSGLRDGDVVTAVNGVPVTQAAVFQFQLDLAGNNDVKLRVKRGNDLLDFTVKAKPVPGVGEEYTLYLAGVRFKENSADAVIANVKPGFPAAKAGVVAGDKIIEIDGKKISDASAALEMLRSMKAKPFEVKIKRADKELVFKLKCDKIVPMTIDASILMIDHPTPWAQFIDTCDMSYKSLRGLLVGAGNKLGITKQQSSIKPGHMSGPLGMGPVLFDSVHRGSLIGGIYFVVVISFALMIFNLLPLPVLDGGHMLFGAIELIIRRPLPDMVIKVLTNIFVVLLIGLMLYVTFSDSRRLFRRFVPATESVKNAPQNP
ncbi:MAG: site-2 protease family protein [Lentisphaeria bacterium]|nr:site-2 protease family protein [Lentisphaeria bacterium]